MCNGYFVLKCVNRLHQKVHKKTQLTYISAILAHKSHVGQLRVYAYHNNNCVPSDHTISRTTDHNAVSRDCTMHSRLHKPVVCCLIEIIDLTVLAILVRDHHQSDGILVLSKLFLCWPLDNWVINMTELVGRWGSLSQIFWSWPFKLLKIGIWEIDP